MSSSGVSLGAERAFGFGLPWALTIPELVVPFLPLAVAAAATSTGAHALWLLIPLVPFVVAPAVELLDGIDPAPDHNSFADHVIAASPMGVAGSVAVFLAHLVAFFWTLGIATEHDLLVPGVESLQGKILLAFGLGLVQAALVGAAIEMRRSGNGVLTTLSRAAMSLPMHAHWAEDQAIGHAESAATPADSDSAKVGESLWRFVIRSWSGGAVRGWRLATDRARARAGRFWLLHHGPAMGTAFGAALWAVALTSFGWGVLPVLVGMTVTTAIFACSVSYIEHYGMLRALRADGTREPLGPQHLWSSPSRLPFVVMSTPRRHEREHLGDNWPGFGKAQPGQLPTGYFGMIFLAFFPPLWARVMDPRVREHVGGDILEANVTDAFRRRELRRREV